jgi:hypothetical protein
MSENRRQILQMLAEGKITADEAERLMSAVERNALPGPGAAAAAAAAAPETAVRRAKYLRVTVDAKDHHSDEPVKVNIRVPMQLLRAGVRLSSLIPPRAREEINRSLHRQGMDFDINQIRPENLEELIEQLSELTVDVDQDRAKVRVFAE